MGKGINQFVLDNASEGIILCDGKLICIFVNKSVMALTNVCIDNTPNKPIEDLLPLMNLDPLLDHFYTAAKGDETKCEISIIRKNDFAKIGISARIIPVKIDDCNYLVAYLTNISKQKQMEMIVGESQQGLNLFYNNPLKQDYILYPTDDTSKRRREQEIMRLLSAAIKAASNAIIITTKQGEIAWVNQAFTRLTGYELEEVKGKKPSILKSGRHSQQFYSQIWDTINSGNVWQGEIFNQRKDGTLYIEEMTITPVFDEEHHITHFIAIKSDITAKKELEQEFRFLNKRFELIFNSSPAGIAIVALRDLRFIEVNSSFLEITKYSKDEIIGFSAKELGLFEKTDNCVKMLIDISVNDEAHHNYDLNVKTKDGNIRNVLVSAERVKLGIEDCVILILNDITEKKLLEEQLLHSQKLESIGTLAGGVAHDFNNILTVIQGHSNLLMMSPLLPNELQESVRQIAEAAERAAGLTRQLLGFSRKQKLEPILLNINSVIENLTKMLKRLIGENIVLECLYQPDLPLVFADIGMMEQVLMNLVVNARDAMPKGGRLTIATSSKFISVNKFPNSDGITEGEYVVISIKDTGQGIKPEYLSKIFDPFFTTKGVGKGTGLGLATVHNIVYQHNGWIEVNSVVDVGTEFIIYIPVAPNKEVKSQPYLWAKGRGETILFVEDNDKIREMTKALLEQCGYNVLPAQDAIAALQLWREYKNKISLLFVDMILPRGITGRQLAEQLCNEKPSIKVILAITYTPEFAQIEFAELKKWLFLQKPYMPSTVVNMVRQILDIKNNHIA